MILVGDCLEIAEEWEKIFLSFLPQEEICLLQKKRRPQDRRRSLAAHGALALEALEAGLDPRAFSRSGEGKPVPPGQGRHCSLAHEGGMALAVLAPDPVGVDLAPRKMEGRTGRAVSAKLCAPGEEELLRCSDTALFFACKEAAGKLTGSGLTGSRRRPVLVPGARLYEGCGSFTAGEFRFWIRPAGELWLAVCTPREAPEPVCRVMTVEQVARTLVKKA